MVESVLVEAVIFLIDHPHYTVVCMPIDSGIEFPLGFLLSGSESEFRLVTLLLLSCPVEEPSR